MLKAAQGGKAYEEASPALTTYLATLPATPGTPTTVNDIDSDGPTPLALPKPLVTAPSCKTVRLNMWHAHKPRRLTNKQPDVHGIFRDPEPLNVTTTVGLSAASLEQLNQEQAAKPFEKTLEDLRARKLRIEEAGPSFKRALLDIVSEREEDNAKRPRVVAEAAAGDKEASAIILVSDSPEAGNNKERAQLPWTKWLCPTTNKSLDAVSKAVRAHAAAGACLDPSRQLR